MHRNSERAARLDELRREVATGLVDAIRGTKGVEQLEFLAIAVEFLDDCGVNRPALVEHRLRSRRPHLSVITP